MTVPDQFVSDSAIWSEKRAREQTDLLHLRLYLADAVTLPAGRWRSRNVRDPFWRFYHNEDSGAFLTCDDLPGATRFPLLAGHSYLVPAGVRFSCGNEAATRHFFVHFEVSGMPRLLMRHAFSQPIPLAPEGDWTTRVESLVAAIRQTRRPDLAQQCAAKALLYEGLGQAIRMALSHDDTAARLAQDREAQEAILPALDYLEAHLADTISIADLAAQCYLSTDHFARRFRTCLGMTPGTYLRERRVEQASRLLLFSTDSIDTIAETCGLGNRYYLSRVFARLMGISPAAYRKAGPRA